VNFAELLGEATARVAGQEYRRAEQLADLAKRYRAGYLRDMCEESAAEYRGRADIYAWYANDLLGIWVCGCKSARNCQCSTSRQRQESVARRHEPREYLPTFPTY
jgi:hypothetical protein